MSEHIRTRFAPSPTGFLHVGSVRTALFAYLLAKQTHGKYILRFEDTDKKREVEGSRAHLLESLYSLNIRHQEGPDIGGPFAPYTQSERLDHYKVWAQKLIDVGRAYADPYSPEEIQELREQAVAQKRAFLYRDYRPENPPVWNGSTPLRFKSDPKAYNWHDLVMGDMIARPENIDDFVIIKSDGFPTYDFAHIVDDAEMEISHVIRGQEFISSVPKYLNLYEALELTPPYLAHVPHILKEEGNKKMGKRDGAKDVLDYIRDGYLPETMISFIATLGWNDGTEQETFTLTELVEKFSLDRVQKSGARFDEKRLLWMNGQFIRGLSLAELNERVKNNWPISAKNHPADFRSKVLALAQDRLKTLNDLPVLTRFFFEEPDVDMSLISENKQLKKLSTQEVKSLLDSTSQALLKVDSWSADTIQLTLNQLLETTGQKPGILFSLIRIVTTWAPFSPQLPETLEIIGKEKTLDRLSRLA